MERFGYPDFLLATADQRIRNQYRDCPHLKPIYDAIVQAAARLGEVTIQARKTYVSLVTPRRTFTRVQAAARSCIYLGLRLDGRPPGGRLQPSRIQEDMLQVRLTAPRDLEAEVTRYLREAYAANCRP